MNRIRNIGGGTSVVLFALVVFLWPENKAFAFVRNVTPIGIEKVGLVLM